MARCASIFGKAAAVIAASAVFMLCSCTVTLPDKELADRING